MKYLKRMKKSLNLLDKRLKEASKINSPEASKLVSALSEERALLEKVIQSSQQIMGVIK